MIFDVPLRGVVSLARLPDVRDIDSAISTGWMQLLGDNRSAAGELFSGASAAADELLAGRHQDALLAAAKAGRAFCTGAPSDWAAADGALAAADPESLDGPCVATLAYRRGDGATDLWQRARGRCAGRPRLLGVVAMIALAAGRADLTREFADDAAALAEPDSPLLTACAELMGRAGGQNADLLERAGRAQLIDGRPSVAVGLLEECLRQQPANARAAVALVEALRLSGRPASTVAEAAERGWELAWRSADPDLTEAAARVVALARSNGGDTVGAQAMLSVLRHHRVETGDGDAAETDDADLAPDDLTLEASILERSPDPGPAIDVLSRMAQGRRTYAPGILRLAQLLSWAGQADDAVAVLAQERPDAEESPRLQIALAAVQEDEGSARALLRAHLAGIPVASVLLAYATDLRELVDEPSQAVDILQLLWDVAPGDVAVLRELVDTLTDLQRPQAIIDLLEPLSDDPGLDARLLGSLADSLRITQQPDRSLDIIDRALAKDPDSTAFRAIRGSTLIQKGDHQQAIAELSDAVRAGFDAPVVIQELVAAHVLAGEPDGAAAVLASLPEYSADYAANILDRLAGENTGTEVLGDFAARWLAEPDLPDAVRVRLCIALGRAELREHLWTAATRTLSIARDIDPTNRTVALMLARALVPTDEDQARALLTTGQVKAGQEETPEPSADDNSDQVRLRTEVLLELREIDAAVAALDEGLSRWPEAVELLLLRTPLRLDTGDLDGAAKDLETVTSVGHQDSEVDRLAARLLIGRGETQQAIDLLQRVLDGEPGDLNTIYLLSSTLVDSGDPARALSLLAGKAFPPEMQAVVQELKARAFAGKGDTLAARDTYQNAVDRNPTLEAARAGLVEAFWALGNTADAVAHLEILGRSGSAWSNLEYARLASKMGMADQALAKAKAYVDEYPVDSYGWYLLGSIHRNAENVTEAVSSFTEALALKPGDLEIAHALGEARLASSDALGAVSVLEKALRRKHSDSDHDDSSRPNLIFTLAEAYDQLGSTQNAVRRVSSLTKTHAANGVVMLLTGQCLARLNAIDQAWDVVELMIEQRNDLEVWILLAILLNDSGLFPQALKTLDRVHDRMPSELRHQQILVWTLRHIPGAAREYLECAESVRHHYGSGSWICRRIGEAHVMLGNRESADRAFLEARDLAGSSLIHAGLCEFLLGDFDKAIDRLMRVTVSRRPGSEGFDLALALAAAGRGQFALEELDRAIEHNRDSWHPSTQRGYLVVAKWELEATAAWLRPDNEVIDKVRSRMDDALSRPELESVAQSNVERWRAATDSAPAGARPVGSP